MTKKILIVDDEPALMAILVDKFSKEKFEILSAQDGKDGLASALKNHPDLILLDIIMPVMDGMTMLGKLRKDQWGKKAKLILLTNLSDARRISKPLTEGVTEYMVKADWKINDIVERVNYILAKKS
jgi:DNA-binding response OmpR family regulator